MTKRTDPADRSLLKIEIEVIEDSIGIQILLGNIEQRSSRFDT